MFVLRFGFVSGLASVVLLACSGSESSAPISADDACNAFAQAYCNRVQECAPVFIQIAYGDAATCATRAKINCLPSLNAPGTSTTATQLQSCTSAITTPTCDDLLSRNLPDACRTIAGQLADGKACADDAQCQNKLCRKASGASCGVCSARAPAGGTCTSDGDCDYGLVCPSKGTKVCVAPGAGGATCDDGHPCKASFGCKAGTCAAVLAKGATCDPTADTCNFAKGEFCAPKAKVCTAIGFAGGGATCGLVNDTFTFCSAAGTCPVKNAATSACVAAAADGQPCGGATGAACLSPATCENGVCKITDPSACK